MTEFNDASNSDSISQTPTSTPENEPTTGKPTRQEPTSDRENSPQEATSRRHFMQFLVSDPEATSDGRFEDLKYESVASYPLGYPSWGAYQNSDPTFRIYKRFGTLRNRIILHRQQELAKMEDELNELDINDDQYHNHRIRSIRRDKADTGSVRTKLIDQIDSKLKEYDDLLEREFKSGLMQKATKRHYRSLVNYLYNRAPIVRSEMKFLKNRDDFVLLTGQSESPLERILDDLICSAPFAWFRRLFSSEAQKNKIDKTKDRHTTLISTEKVEQLARAIASSLAILLIGVPLYVLASKIFSDRTKIAVLLVALVLFPTAIQIAARPKNHDLFATSAAYCAVLSTFLATSANFGQSQTEVFGNSTLFH